MKRLAKLLLFLCLCAAAAANVAPWEISPPAKPKAEIWLEGEAFVQSRGGKVAADSSCYGGKSWELLTQTAGEYTVKYEFRVPADGIYSVQVAGQPVGTGYTSPIWYRVDSSPWVKVTTLPASQLAWGRSKAVRWTVLGSVSLTAGKHTLEFKVDEKRPQDNYFAYIIDAVAISLQPGVTPKLRGLQPANVFTTEQKIAFESTDQIAVGQWNWRVINWQGEELHRGLWEAKQGTLELPELPVGYYRLQLQDKQGNWNYWVPFARILSLSEREINPDSPYAMDSAQSWLASPGYAGNTLQPPNAYELISDLEQAAGLSMVRERLSWGEVNPEPGVYSWGRYETNANLLSERGIAVVGMFHSAPDWTKGDLRSLPHDLMATYEFCKAAAEKFSGQMLAWEFWNEPELKGFNQDPSWDLAAAHKAAYLGFKAGDPNVDVLIASNCQHPAPLFFELLMQNGVGDYMDAFNFHVYSRLEEYPSIVAEKREFLTRYGQEHKPMWLTENGLRVEGEGKEDPIVPGSNLWEHDPQQELMQAELMVKANVLMHALGVDKNFFFVFPPYNEQGGSKVWGIFRWDYTVKPAYAALANLTAQLGPSRYLGKLDLGEGISAYLYEQPDGKQLLVYWADEDKEFILKDQRELEMLDFLGGSQKLAAKGGCYELVAGKFPTYLKGLVGLEPTELPLPKAAAKPPQTTDLDTVLRVDLGTGFRIENQNFVELESPEGNFTLDIFNFSTEPKELTIEYAGDVYQLLGIPEKISVPAMDKVSVPVKMLRDDSVAEVFNLKLWTRRGDLVSAPVLIPVSPGLEGLPSLEEKLFSGVEPHRWEKNTSGDLRISFDPLEDAVRFDVTFSPTVDHWVYPVFRLESEESLAGAVGLSFEVKADFDPAFGDNPYRYALVMAVLEDHLELGERVDFAYEPTTEWKKVNIFFPAEAPENFDPAKVRLLRIGMNPRQDQLTYWLRNLKIYYQK